MSEKQQRETESDLLYLHGNGSTDFTQNSGHSGTKRINYSPPAAYSEITLCPCIYSLLFPFFPPSYEDVKAEVTIHLPAVITVHAANLEAGSIPATIQPQKNKMR